MKSIAILLSLIALSSAVPVVASGSNSISDYAEVVSVEPILRTTRVRVPTEECYDVEERSKPSYAMTNGVAGAVVGAIAGGVAGHQFGKGRGKDVATATGAVIGAGVGQRVAHQNYPDGESRTVTRCTRGSSYQSEERLSGYEVQYRYMGRIFRTTMRERPGSSLPVRITVTPAR